MADIDWCRPEGVAVNNGEATASSLSGRCAVAVNDGITGRMPFLPPNQQRQSTEGTT